MSFQKTILLLTACAATALAQTGDLGLGTNPEAQGATSDVTPGAGPNGYVSWKPSLLSGEANNAYV